MNPRPATLASLDNGRRLYEINCAPCHGASGRGDGPVSMTGPLQGPIAAVLPPEDDTAPETIDAEAVEEPADDEPAVTTREEAVTSEADAEAAAGDRR